MCVCVCVCVYGQGTLTNTDVNSRISGWDFPGGPVVRLCSFSAGGAGSIPGQGARSHMLCGQKKEKNFRLVISIEFDLEAHPTSNLKICR